MVTTTSTTATPTPTVTPTPTATSVTQTAAQSLLTSLNAGSGIDTASLIPALVQAQFATKTAQLNAKADTLTAQISGISSIKSAITGFSAALDTLVKGGTLATQPTSSNSSVLTATALSGAKLAGLSSSIVVTALATAQATRTNTAVATRDTSVGTGKMTLSIGAITYDTASPPKATGVGGGKSVTFDVGSGSLTDVAAAINAQGLGVSASVVTDAKGGAFLSLKGTTGAAQAFTLTAATDATGNLKSLDMGPGSTGDTTVTATAQDASLSVDGIGVTRSSNTISDLVDGVKLELTGVSGSAVKLGTTSPAAALTQAVSDVVDTYNQVLAAVTKETDPKTGTLRADPAAQALLRSMKAITLARLLPSSAGSPGTLAEIGVATNRDGTLRVDSPTLIRQMATAPAAVEAMFAPSADGTTGLSALLKSMSLSASSTTAGLGASQARYTKAETDITDAKSKISLQSDQMTTRLTQQFASMNSRVTAYKSTQAFLTNQIAAWNKPSA